MLFRSAAQAEIIDERDKAIATRKKEVEIHQRDIANKIEEIKHLKELLQLARHRAFASSSERHVDQLSLFNEAEDQTATGLTPDPDDEIEVKYKRKRKPKRSPIPSHIPREDIHYDLVDEEKSCPCCGEELSPMGEVVSEQLDIIPARVSAKRHIRKKYGCNKCKQTVKTATMPKQPIPKSLASPGLLATICVNKYADGMPLFRQESILMRAGIELGRTTMASWMIKLGELFTPLYNILRDDLLDRKLIQMDETSVQVLKEPGRKAQTKSFIWVMASGRHGQDPPIILFHYDPSRSSKVPRALLADWRGYLVTDGYDGYGAVVLSNNLIHCGCFDHVRRKFKDVIKSRPKGASPGLADEALWYLQRLYNIERRIKRDSSKHRLKIRNLYSRSVLDHFRRWLDRVIDSVRPTSSTGKALHYLASEWPKLVRILENGDVPLSNELCENAIRPFVIGRKAWLFSASQAGAKSSCMIYSIIETAKANGHEPYAYLRYIIERLPNCENLEDFEALLPYRVSPEACAAAL